MGMQDNPLVGDYTKGISKNTAQYFRDMDARARREKEDPARFAIDFANPLFAVMRGAVNPLDLDQKGRLKPEISAQNQGRVKSTAGAERRENVPKKQAKVAWKSINLSDLKQILDGR